MAGIEPIVRNMLLCDDVRPDPDYPRKIDVFGLINTLRATTTAAFPLLHPELCVYLQLTEIRRRGDGRIVAINADTADPVFASGEHEIRASQSPLDVLGFVFRIRDCTFPRPGLYLIQFRYNGEVLAQQPLLVR